MRAIRRHLRISSKKVNLVADLVRGKPAQEAIDFLRFTPKHAAKPMMETLKSAVANAEQNFKQDKKNLYVSKIVVNEGATLKRQRPVSRGRSHPINNRTAHITVEVAVMTGETAAAKAAKAEKTPAKAAKAAKTSKK